MHITVASRGGPQMPPGPAVTRQLMETQSGLAVHGCPIGVVPGAVQSAVNGLQTALPAQTPPGAQAAPTPGAGPQVPMPSPKVGTQTRPDAQVGSAPPPQASPAWADVMQNPDPFDPGPHAGEGQRGIRVAESGGRRSPST